MAASRSRRGTSVPSPHRMAATSVKVTIDGASFLSRRKKNGFAYVKWSGARNWLQIRFADLSSRVENHRELDALVESWTTQHTPHQVMLILQREGIAAGVVQTAEDLYRDPHLRERGFARDVYHKQVGWVTRVGPSVRLTETRNSGEEIVHSA